MKEPLPARQQAVLDAVRRSLHERAEAPTILEIARELGVSGPTVHQHLRALERKGFLRRKPGSPRGLALVDAVRAPRPAGCVRVPIVGEVAGGPPIFAFEQPLGFVTVNRRTAPSDVLFALRVRGDSMIDAGILDGDLVVVRQQPAADDGDIVIALVNDEATVKRLRRRAGKVILQPENSELEPTEVVAEELRILGKVVAVERVVDEA